MALTDYFDPRTYGQLARGLLERDILGPYRALRTGLSGLRQVPQLASLAGERFASGFDNPTAGYEAEPTPEIAAARTAMGGGGASGSMPDFALDALLRPESRPGVPYYLQRQAGVTSPFDVTPPPPPPPRAAVTVGGRTYDYAQGQRAPLAGQSVQSDVSAGSPSYARVPNDDIALAAARRAARGGGGSVSFIQGTPEQQDRLTLERLQREGAIAAARRALDPEAELRRRNALEIERERGLQGARYGAQAEGTIKQEEARRTAYNKALQAAIDEETAIAEQEIANGRDPEKVRIRLQELILARRSDIDRSFGIATRSTAGELYEGR